MTRSDGRTRLLMTVVLLLPVSGCVRTGGQTAGGEDILEYGTPSEYLNCPQAGEVARADTQVIGPAGGRLQIGITELNIPAGALLEERRFVLEQENDEGLGVMIDGGGSARLQRSAELRIDVSGCDAQTLANPRGWWVWRLNSVEGQSQKLRTRISARDASTTIDSTSTFMIAN